MIAIKGVPVSAVLLVASVVLLVAMAGGASAAPDVERTGPETAAMSSDGTVSGPARMTPSPPAELAQVMGSVCRWGVSWCWLTYPMPVGSPCFCPGQGSGVVTMW